MDERQGLIGGCGQDVQRREKYAVVREKEVFLGDPRTYSYSKWHDCFADAKAEAERLCKKEQVSFYVLKVVAKCKIDERPVVWEEVN